MNKKAKLIVGGTFITLAIASGFMVFMKSPGDFTNRVQVAKAKVISENGKTVKEFNLTAEPKKITLKDGVQFEAWTYGGSVPGSQIRVTEGDTVRVTLKNNLPDPTSIHWHGLPVPNAMDGIPGVTQNAVKPGESFTYEFTATTPGTYWYHSHQKSAEQEDMGLYGTIIVDPKNPTVKYDKDVTLVLDEWMAGSNNSMSGMSGMDHSNMSGMSGMDHSSMNMSGNASHDEMMKQMYNLFTVNGAAGSKIQPINLKAGERVKLRFVNAGFQTHLINLHNQPFKITDTDGQPIQVPTELKNELVAIAPGERYDIEFTASDSFTVDDYNDSAAAEDINIPVIVGGKKPQMEHTSNDKLSTVDLTKYGAKETPKDQKYNKEFQMILNNSKDASGEEKYTINGQVFPDIPPLTVKKDDWVKVTFKNVGTSDHPMHLHGHFFQVLTKNGQPLQSDIMKDTLNVRPGEEYVIAFQANNDGDWMFHCHDLHHAAAGMMTELKYEGYKPSFTPDASANNMPE
ncbi:multicopper oxidase family protein [Tumebacillus sp. ITR2]|uniref:Copper-containing nitrite reductase n=1 Tax=Tumebacillus amylolyticus TaxID=2801339 RepID=A0ABS1J5N1_9BACL|nr:multicopper oxidase family protein [Tumebacillus amylolyticus]MBL0385570.1 multicopper oxidase family protein [Tumebacillus amylolyticus]